MEGAEGGPAPRTLVTGRAGELVGEDLGWVPAGAPLFPWFPHLAGKRPVWGAPSAVPASHRHVFISLRDSPQTPTLFKNLVYCRKIRT